MNVTVIVKLTCVCVAQLQELANGTHDVPSMKIIHAQFTINDDAESRTLCIVDWLLNGGYTIDSDIFLNTTDKFLSETVDYNNTQHPLHTLPHVSNMKIYF